MVASASDDTILAVDVERFGSRGRTGPVLVAVRAAVHRIVETACTRAGVPWKRCYHEARAAVHAGQVRHDPDSDAAAYRRVRVRVKETKRHAWVTRPDGALAHAGRRRVVHATTER